MLLVLFLWRVWTDTAGQAPHPAPADMLSSGIDGHSTVPVSSTKRSKACHAPVSPECSPGSGMMTPGAQLTSGSQLNSTKLQGFLK